MSTPFITEISIVAFNFAPKGYALCNGQLLPINQNQALFSLLGTTYGGNGQTTFGLPNLQGRIAMHMGNGHTLGEVSGSAYNTLTPNQIMAHSHAITADMQIQTGTTADTPSPANAFAAPAANGSPRYSNQADDKMSAIPINQLQVDPSVPFMTENNVTQGFPVENRMPYLCLNFIIALQGVFPSQT
ncbi:phage tail protein [Chitinophaga flava]|uniref:Phage tail protein n=1 Tax=Chitinophaga flava TaxID=2259036 RepID=A0A365XW29_9BACT|nr:tail fiber protein [Chitinophaga flava]RBL89914.1 phage tail protein [Chitinophaga flava]